MLPAIIPIAKAAYHIGSKIADVADKADKANKLYNAVTGDDNQKSASSTSSPSSSGRPPESLSAMSKVAGSGLGTSISFIPRPKKAQPEEEDITAKVPAPGAA